MAGSDEGWAAAARTRSPPKDTPAAEPEQPETKHLPTVPAMISLPCWLACIMRTKSCGMVFAGQVLDARVASGVREIVVRLVRVSQGFR